MSALHHVGITVPELDQSVAFFCHALGARVEYHEGPVSDPDGDWMARQLNVDPRAELRAAMLRLPCGSRIECFQYSAPRQRTEWPANSDHGASHLGIEVDDIDAAVDRLRAYPGVRFLGEIETESLPEAAGDRWIYFLAPWGLQMELVMPAGARCVD